jgi:hypothetical protein
MKQPHKPMNTSRVLRFTVTSALAIAPLAGCGPSHTSNPGPIEVVEPNTNPGLEPEPVAVEVDAGEEIDAGTDSDVEADAGVVLPRQPSGANPGPHGNTRPTPDERLDAIRRQIHANPGPNGPPVES